MREEPSVRCCSGNRGTWVNRANITRSFAGCRSASRQLRRRSQFMIRTTTKWSRLRTAAVRSLLKWNNRTCALYDCEMTQDEIEAGIRAEWGRLSKTEKADKDRM